MTYQGLEVVTQDNLVRYFVENYGEDLAKLDEDPDGNPAEIARQLVTKHQSLLDEGIKNSSFAYYVGDVIADKEGWLNESTVDNLTPESLDNMTNADQLAEQVKELKKENADLRRRLNELEGIGR